MKIRSNTARLIAASFAVAAAAAMNPVYAADPVAADPAPANYAGDALLTSKVKAALVEAKDVSSLKINVTTNDGVVVLKGEAPTTEAAQQAVAVAAGVDGVKDVKSELKLAR